MRLSDERVREIVAKRGTAERYWSESERLAGETLLLREMERQARAHVEGIGPDYLVEALAALDKEVGSGKARSK